MSLVEKIKNAPNQPGVYIFKGVGEEVIYVGKAKNLNKRLYSYITKRDFKASIIMNYAVDVEYFTVPTDREALILEDSLIYKYSPKFNVHMTSDVTYSYIVINDSLKFPTIKLEFRRSRRMTSERLGYRVIGPFTSRAMAKTLYELAQKVFGIRDCKWNEKKKLSRPCNLGEIGKCSMPCVGRISQIEYISNVEQFLKVATSSPSEIKRYLYESMREASRLLQFEKAIVYRDALKEFSQISMSQITINGFSGIALIAAFKDGKGVAVIYFIKNEVRDVLVWHYMGDNVEEFYDRVAADVYSRLYEDGMDVIVFTPPIAKTLRLLGCRVSDIMPEDLAMEMATTVYSHLTYKSDLEDGYLMLKRILELDVIPMRIEGYDNAHFQGSYPMGGMVTFIGGSPSPRHYRIFHLNPFRNADVDMMYEMIVRRLKHPEWGYPSLMVIDGSKAQLNYVIKAHNDVGIDKQWRIVAIDKDTGMIHLDTGKSMYLEETNPAKRFLRWVMAEAHRFINKSHRENRDKIVGIFDSVKGLGEKRIKQLVDAFGGFYGIYNASIRELISRGGLPENVAKELYDRLHG